MKKSMLLKGILAIAFVAAGSLAAPSKADAGMFGHKKASASYCYTLSYCYPTYYCPPVYCPPVYCPPVCYYYCYPTYYCPPYYCYSYCYTPYYYCR